MKLLFNPTTLSGASDIVMVEHPDGTIKSSPWLLRFGNLQFLKHFTRTISVSINDNPAPFTMYVNEWGIGQFYETQNLQERKLASNKIYPTKIHPTVNLTPQDIRGILESKTNEPTLGNDFSKFIERDSAVDIDIVFTYSDPDPKPVEAVSSHIDLTESIHYSEESQMTKDIETKQPVPSELILQEIRPFLHYGRNKITFTVSSLLQGPKTVNTLIFLYKYTDKLIISDIDGTITCSDAIGQACGFIGADWSQPGVAKLFNQMSDHGLYFLYLSSRPVSQATVTRDIIERINQGGLRLPDGPCITSNDSLLGSLTREIIIHNPESFKIPIIGILIDLWPKDQKPVVLALGNKQNDVRSYAANKILPEEIILFDMFHRVFDSTGKIKLYDSIKTFSLHLDEFLKKLHIIG
ncbi:nuclear elongation and deformation protein, putative [Trichomonas vaginalis G3]|uniref:Nuclear elongation and deformation protein, putative n=1 Tax=Trichomonas vaginalis (strain ATCC PRA-98 / G3) TaxID=412133 RepID=A2FBC3_TRIV3|nr:phosphatidate phosphatase protein [Trichomonas vaginalis G3]EAX97803.1 nuclear elongation and deformation protein, putative [Trichomonas vaginalis G3]KAI5552721.1 phosphatidate phosphatase protein [Trichomonas vaginalis G3]|eukprot:XP_001310733.1 nuclear elongation and deformation protein [Trichomonas vaginalis G3]